MCISSLVSDPQTTQIKFLLFLVIAIVLRIHPFTSKQNLDSLAVVRKRYLEIVYYSVSEFSRLPSNVHLFTISLVPNKDIRPELN